ncbi:3-beta hydroxysteroid dehydrogenase [Longibacter salinarum]|uniref:3-beta hydroxysteroid dehydrogenase n=1 Tax=Longibacter salinarum TaxID=1850348 RepID=A0A2A8CVS8_9BACT|nr:NAD-dependent epimerase/dehydratase family protein [Longibacter salinarum]PEN12859.1 3-beta hydroxysteroid dehydrogenase [Longibacter salinarum]
MKLVIPGGNGFIGSHICEVAVNAGHDVVAFGRSGEPDLTPVRHPWVGKVTWLSADVFDVDAWSDVLDGADAVIHTIGTIVQDPSNGITFERINGEAAIVAADAAAKSGVDTFVKLSIQDKPPGVSGRFLASMRRAERTIPERFPSLRSVFLQPNLVFGDDRFATCTMAGLLQAAARVVPFPYGSHEGRPLPVQSVAAAAVHAAAQDTLKGPLNVNQIDDIARTSGLIDPSDLPEPTLRPLLAGLGGATMAYWMLRRSSKTSESSSVPA